MVTPDTKQFRYQFMPEAIFKKPVVYVSDSGKQQTELRNQLLCVDVLCLREDLDIFANDGSMYIRPHSMQMRIVRDPLIPGLPISETQARMNFSAADGNNYVMYFALEMDKPKTPVDTIIPQSVYLDPQNLSKLRIGLQQQSEDNPTAILSMARVRNLWLTRNQVRYQNRELPLDTFQEVMRRFVQCVERSY